MNKLEDNFISNKGIYHMTKSNWPYLRSLRICTYLIIYLKTI
jgi:hypothetical protein